MNNVFRYTATCGLKCIFVKRSGFKQQYCGIGCHYGSGHRNYERDGERYTSKSGIAHFLEHKAFLMKDGKDALEIFDEMNCEANAYTSREQTIYYFQTADELIPPLRILLEMYFTKGFTEENIASEKPIILSELENQMDRVDARVYNECMSLLYPEDTYSEEILGSKEDVESMTESDLDEIFSAFYTPENSLFVVISDLESNLLIREIEDVLSKLTLSHGNAHSIPFITSKTVAAPKVIEEYVPYPELHILGRIPNTDYHTPIVTNQVIALLDGIFSVEAPFYKELSKEGLLLMDDIEYSVATHEYGSYYHIEIYTEEPEVLLDKIGEKLKCLTEADYYEDISKATIKLYLCDYIRALDSISYVGDETLTLGLEGTDYFLEYDALKNTKKEDILAYLPKIRDSEFTYLIVLPKDVEEKEEK